MLNILLNIHVENGKYSGKWTYDISDLDSEEIVGTFLWKRPAKNKSNRVLS